MCKQWLEVQHIYAHCSHNFDIAIYSTSSDQSVMLNTNYLPQFYLINSINSAFLVRHQRKVPNNYNTINTHRIFHKFYTKLFLTYIFVHIVTICIVNFRASSIHSTLFTVRFVVFNATFNNISVIESGVKHHKPNHTLFTNLVKIRCSLYLFSPFFSFSLVYTNI